MEKRRDWNIEGVPLLMTPLDVVDPSPSALQFSRASTSLLPSPFFLNGALIIGLGFLASLLLFSLKVCLYELTFFLSLFLFRNVKYDMQDILRKLFMLAFLCIFPFLIWKLDEEINSFLLDLAPHIDA